MYADRRRAFETRIGELFNDHKAAYPVRKMSNNAWRDLGGRILSALEDAYKMGLGEFQQEHRAKIDSPPEKD